MTKTVKTQETAAQALARNLTEAHRRWRLIEVALEKAERTQNPNWGDVGSMAEVVSLLGQAGHYLCIPELTEK